MFSVLHAYREYIFKELTNFKLISNDIDLKMYSKCNSQITVCFAFSSLKHGLDTKAISLFFNFLKSRTW